MFRTSKDRRKDGRAATLRVVGCDRAAPIAAGETLLGAAVRGQLPLPYLCNAGECGACKCRLVKGHVRLKKDISGQVSAEELSAGFLLACQSVAESEEVELEIAGAVRARSPGPSPVWTEAVITRATPLAPDVMALEVGLASDVRYVAGQYAQLTVPGVPGLSEPRCYSFAEAPDRTSPRRALFHVRHVPGGVFTGWLFDGDRTGAQLGFSGPHGSFRYQASDRPLLCVAGGTGLAPIKAILEQALSEGLARDLTLVVGARTRKDLYALDAIAAIAERWQRDFTFAPVLSQEPAGSGWMERRGHVTDYLRQNLAELADCAAYLCGPPGMIDASIEVLKGAIPEEHLHCDRFLDRGSIALDRPRAA
jgi:CDP-4-dehydro-6-deoxyglucose reductase